MYKFIFLLLFCFNFLLQGQDIAVVSLQGRLFEFHAENFFDLKESALYHDLFENEAYKDIIFLDDRGLHLDSFVAIHHCIENKKRTLPQPVFQDLPLELSLEIRSYVPYLFNKIFYDDLCLLKLQNKIHPLKIWSYEEKHDSEFFDIKKLYMFGEVFEFIQYKEDFSFLKTPLSEKQYHSVVCGFHHEKEQNPIKNLYIEDIEVFLTKFNKECEKLGFYSGFSLPSPQEWLSIASWNKFVNMNLPCEAQKIWLFYGPEWSRAQLSNGGRIVLNPLSQGVVSEYLPLNILSFRMVRDHSKFYGKKA